MSAFTIKIGNYLSLVKFSHTIFAMPFALLGFFSGVKSEYGEFTLRSFLLVVLCMVLARNAAMGFNRYIDNKIDKLNPRTMNREIPVGTISPGAALAFVIINSILFIIAAAFINSLTLWLSPIALAVVLGYSLTKRFTSLSHFFLGLGLSLAPIGAYISVTGQFNIIPLIYSFVVLTWVAGFDIIYSLQDTGFDRKHDLFSIPSRLGTHKALIISLLLHIISIMLVVLAGIIAAAGLFFWIGVIAFTILLIWEHIIIKPGDSNNINMAFATLNSYAGVLFTIAAIADLYL